MARSPASVLRDQRARAPSRQKVEKQGPNPGGRFILLDKSLAKSSAKQMITKGIKRGNFQVVMGNDDQALKFSVERMGETVGADADQMDKLRKMDAEKLNALYDNNDLVFDVFFNYEGVTDHGDFKTVSQDKKSDIDFFVQQYERAYGVIK